MTTRTMHNAFARAYADKLRDYYDRQSRHPYMWLKMFAIGLESQTYAPYTDDSFLSALLMIKPHVLGRILLYDAEGYIHAMDKVRAKEVTL